MTAHEAATLIVASLRANHVRLAYVRGEGWPTQMADDGVLTLAEVIEPILTDAIKAAVPVGDRLLVFAERLVTMCSRAAARIDQRAIDEKRELRERETILRDALDAVSLAIREAAQ